MSAKVFNVLKDPRNGNIICSGMCDQGYLETKVYIGYTIKEAKKMFNQHLKAVNQ
jgi:hypothetical protein